MIQNLQICKLSTMLLSRPMKVSHASHGRLKDFEDHDMLRQNHFSWDEAMHPLLMRKGSSR